MRNIALFLFVTALISIAAAQTPGASTAVTPAVPAALSASLDRLQSTASQANLDIAHMRIEKWKADNGSKQQAQANADSLQRNLSSALPGLIAAFRSAPQDLNAAFKLYRNLNALYDVFASFTEATGAFGAKNDYETLAQQLNVIDSARHDLGDNLEMLSASTQAQLNQLRAQVSSMQQAAAAAPPKKVVVDDTAPAKKSTHKKTPASAAPPASGSAAKSQ